MVTGGEPRTSITCDGCGRHYAWKPQLAGRKVKCRCGQVMTAPAAPVEPQRDEDGLYDLAPEPAPAAPSRPIPITSAASVVTGGAAPLHVLPPSGAVEYQRPDIVGAGGPMELYFPDRVKDLYLPLGLIAGGTIIEFVLALLLRRGGLEGAARSVMWAGGYMIVNTVLMLIAIFFVAKVRDITFGPFPTAILKLCALSIGPGAIGSLVGVMLMWVPLLGGLIGWIIGFILYFALIGALFDLDESDTWWCVITVFVVKLFVFFGLVVYIMGRL